MQRRPEHPPTRVLECARWLTERQMRDLSRGVTALAGRFGTKRTWLNAWQQATKAAASAGLGDEVVRLSNESLLAVLEASADTARAKGRDVTRLAAELQRFHEAPQDDEAVKRLHAAARKSLGIRSSQRVGPASLGAGAAAVALFTEHLAASAAYTVEAHGLLLQPWRRAIDPGPDDARRR